MPLTKSQRRVLTAYRRYREDGGPRLASFFGPLYFWPLAAVSTVAVLMVGIGLLWYPVLPFATLLAGVFVGRVMTDRRYYQQTRALWPLSSQLIDWRRVDELLDQANQEHS